jgi:hypothetical protein
MPNQKITERTRRKINEAIEAAGCSNWSICEEDSRYVVFTCKCGKTGRKLKQQLVKRFSGCSDCSKKGISSKVIKECKQKCEELGYTYKGVSERARSIIVVCKCHIEFTVFTNNWKNTKTGSCDRCRRVADLLLPVLPAPAEKIEEKYEKGPWTGGIPVGYLQETDERVKVNFKKEHGGCGKTFHKKVHGSFTRAIAESFQKRECEKRGLTRNQVRLVTVISHPVLPAGYEYYEMKLLQNNGRGNQKIEKFMKLETDQLEFIRSKGAVRAYLEKGKKTSYAWIGRAERNKKVHNRLYPQFSEVDHIDRDGLNNLRSNVREGKGRVNALNKGKQKNNTSGYTGVRYEAPKGNRKGRWKVQWPKKNNKTRGTKSFTLRVNTEEEKEFQKQRAIAFREEEMRITRESEGM